MPYPLYYPNLKYMSDFEIYNEFQNKILLDFEMNLVICEDLRAVICA